MSHLEDSPAATPQELAPDGCIICHKARPAEIKKEGRGRRRSWFYLAGSKPVGAMACSRTCLDMALERHQRTGRVDP